MQRDVITLFLRGGLGNILFQIAAALAISRKVGLPVVVVKDFANPFLEPETGRLVTDVLGHFGFPELARTTRPHLLDLSGEFLRGRRWMHDNNLGKFLGKPSPIHPFVISGYFQSWPLLKTEITEISELVRALLVQANLELGQAPSGSIHLRLGDYTSHARVFGTLSAEYYAKSIRTLSTTRKASGGVVSVFTNDVIEAKRRLEGFPFPLDFRSNPSALQTMLSMSESQWIVGSNSTFSWWSAAVGGFVPLALPKPFLVDKRVNKRVNLDSSNVSWVSRDN